MDFKKAKSETYKYQHNVIGRENISEATVRNLILRCWQEPYWSVFTWPLLPDGCASDGVGGLFYRSLLYLWPHSLSRMPLGEVFSGVTMGLGILPSRSISILLIKKCFIWHWICERNLWLSGEPLGRVCHRCWHLCHWFSRLWHPC